jgi:hypothetical protein
METPPASAAPVAAPPEGWPTVAIDRRIGGRHKLTARPMPFPGVVEGLDVAVDIQHEVRES